MSFAPIEECMETSEDQIDGLELLFSHILWWMGLGMLGLLYRARCWVVFLFADMTDVIFLFPGPWSGHSCQITFENSTSVLFVPPGFPWVKLNPISFSVPWWNCGRYWSLLIFQSWLERSLLTPHSSSDILTLDLDWTGHLTMAASQRWGNSGWEKLSENFIRSEIWGYLEHLPWRGIHYFDS